MPDNTPTDSTPEEALGFDPKPIVVSMGMVISNHLQHRWLSAFDAQEAVDECCTLLDEVFRDCGEITFGAFEHILKVNDVEVETAGTTAAVLVSQMEALEAHNFTLSRGLSSKVFADLLEVLSAQPLEIEQLGGFAGFLAEQNFENVVIRHITYRQVTDEEVVVQKAAMDSVAAIADADGAARNDLMAYLKGEKGDEEHALEVLNSAASDSTGMAELIVEVARETDDGASDRVSADSVVVALRRAFDGWMKSPGLKTQKGKKALGKTLKGIEEEVRNRLMEAGVEVEEEDDILSDAVESMADELKMDALAAEYLKKRKAIEASEARILRYIRNKGRDNVVGSDLEQKLHDGGLGGANWRELLVRSGVAGTGAGGGEVASAVAVASLSSKLSLIAKNLQQPGDRTDDETAGELTDALKDVAVDVDALVTDTNRKIQDIIEEYKADEEGEGGQVDMVGAPEEKKRMSRKQLYEHLSEIGQEICQPLSVINCSLSMITSGRLGDITETQDDMLKLASENTDKLKALADNLMEVTGVPDTLEPDAGIQSKIYDL
ncbi:MAG: hypothetical protein QGI24_02595 [Kiritimatiellia bacterium]|jgi:hypothetical protein|nr:hypothetical protein [Kiritimatiellia bacterium]MDP6847652.1 hypothetical protein [Kiritimatiellia bacterium]